MRTPNDWHDTFLTMARAIAGKSKDPSTQCGAVLVAEDREILATGFNGPPAAIIDHLVPWESRPEKYAYIFHAEENALWFAVGSHGFDRIKSATMYATHAPCAECTLRLLRCNVGKVVIPHDSPDYPLSKYQVTPESIIHCSNRRLETHRHKGI